MEFNPGEMTDKITHSIGEWNSSSNLKKIAAVLAIISMLSFFILPDLLQNSQSVKIVVRNGASGEPVQGASVLLLDGGQVIGLKRTHIAGNAEFRVQSLQGLTARIEAPGYKSKTSRTLKENNEVSLELDLVNAQGGSFTQPSLVAPAFNLYKESEKDGLAPAALQQMEQDYEQDPTYSPAVQPAEVTEVDCTEIDSNPVATQQPIEPSPAVEQAPVTPTLSSEAQPTGQSTAQAPESQITPTPQAENQIFLNYQATTEVGGETIEFYDYSADGKIRLKVYAKAGEYTLVLEPSEKVELAGGSLEFVYSEGEPPTAFLRYYPSTVTPTASAGTSPSPSTKPTTTPSASVTPLATNSPLSIQITSPTADSVISTKTQVSGIATATSGVQLVEVSVDGGVTWSKATGGSKWAAEIDYAAPGSITLKARVTDCKGNTKESDGINLHGSACKALVYHGPHEKKYDLVLVTSKYDGNLEKFYTHAENALEAVFSTPPFNTLELYSKFNVFFYNAEASCKIAGEQPPENRAWKCEIPKAYYESCPFADLSVVFVNSELRAGKSGNPVVASAGEKEILLHELGHSVFGLADEYCCDGGYWENAPSPNIYQTIDKCEQQTANTCFGIGEIGWSHVQVKRGVMEALENHFFDQSDLPAIREFMKKYE